MNKKVDVDYLEKQLIEILGPTVNKPRIVWDGVNEEGRDWDPKRDEIEFCWMNSKYDETPCFDVHVYPDGEIAVFDWDYNINSDIKLIEDVNIEQVLELAQEWKEKLNETMDT